MKCEILFIQGAGTESMALEEPMVHELHQQLGPEFHIRHPEMQEADHPQYNLWKEQLAKEINSISSPLILLGHSLGGSVLLKYFSENPVPDHVKGLILFGMPFWGADQWKYQEFELDKDSVQQLQALNRVYIYHSRADEEVPFAHLAHYLDILPGAHPRKLSEADHFYQAAVNDMVKDIREIATALK